MIFEFIRSLTCNFNEIEKFVPEKGKVLDVGCGHGIFSKLLVDKSKERFVLGIDPSEKKIALANKNFGHLKQLKFSKKYLSKVKGKFDAIVVIDVLYLLPPKEKTETLKKAKNLLKENGKLILVINGKEPGWIYNLLEIEEKIMTNILKLTYTDYKKTYFESEESIVKLLKKAGFKIERVEKIKSFLPYPHILFVASVSF